MLEKTPDDTRLRPKDVAYTDGQWGDLPKFVHRHVDRHGRPRHYLRRPGFPIIRLPGLPSSPEFMAAYEQAMAEKHFSEIELDRQEAQDLADRYFGIMDVLMSRIESKHPRSRRRSRPTLEIEVSTPASFLWDVGRALRGQLLKRSWDRCDCRSCRDQHTKRGQRENYWVSLIALAQMGDPSNLVKHLNSRRTLTRFDRRILADLLDAVFKGESHISPSSGRPKNIAVQSCAYIALEFYNHWKAINRQLTINDWGHSDQMKDEACRAAIECHQVAAKDPLRVPITNDWRNEVPSFEQVRELTERPRGRRLDHGDFGIGWRFAPERLKDLMARLGRRR